MRSLQAALVGLVLIASGSLAAAFSETTNHTFNTSADLDRAFKLEVNFGATAHSETISITVAYTSDAGAGWRFYDVDLVAAATTTTEYDAGAKGWRFSSPGAGGGSATVTYVTPSYSGTHRFELWFYPYPAVASPVYPDTITVTVTNSGAAATATSVAMNCNDSLQNGLGASTTSGSYTQVHYSFAYCEFYLGSATDELAIDFPVDFGATAAALDVSVWGMVFDNTSAGTTGTGGMVVELRDLAAAGGATAQSTANLPDNLSSTGRVAAMGSPAYTTASLSGTNTFRVICKAATGMTADKLCIVYVTWQSPATLPTTAPTPKTAPTVVSISPAGGALAPGATIGAAWTSTTVISATGGTGSPTTYTWSLPNGPAWVSIVQTSPTNNITLTGTPPTGTAASVNIDVRATNGTTGEWDQETFTLAVAGGASNTVSIAASATPAAEPSTNSTFTITFNPATTASTDISWTITGTATLNTDYSLSSSVGTLSSGGITAIPAATTTVTVTVTVINDISVEGLETVIVTLNSATAGYTVATAPGNSATLNINDDDGSTVTVSASVAAASEPSTNGQYTVTFSPATTATTDIVFTTNTGTATSPDDFTITTSSVGVASTTGVTGIPSGTTTFTITLTVTNNTVAESSETAILVLTSATAGYTVGAPSSATINIADDDTAGTPVVTIAASGTPSETGPVGGTFTLTATPAPASNIVVNVTWGGTATNPADYTSATTTTVTIGTSGTATVTFSVVDDTATEGTETVTLTVASGVGYTVGATSTASRNITDNEGGGGGGGTIGVGGGGGGGGCSAETGDSRWLALLALLALAAVLYRARKARA